MNDIIINWLYHKKNKMYCFYIQIYPFDNTTRCYVSEKELNKVGMTPNRYMDIIQDYWDNTKNLDEAIKGAYKYISEE